MLQFHSSKWLCQNLLNDFQIHLNEDKDTNHQACYTIICDCYIIHTLENGG